MRQVEKRKFSCFCDTQLPTVSRLPFAVNVMLNLSINNDRDVEVDINTKIVVDLNSDSGIERH